MIRIDLMRSGNVVVSVVVVVFVVVDSAILLLLLLFNWNGIVVVVVVAVESTKITSVSESMNPSLSIFVVALCSSNQVRS